jgi:hypothetical protein
MRRSSASCASRARVRAGGAGRADRRLPRERVEDGDDLVMAHCYVERRLRPLNLYVREANRPNCRTRRARLRPVDQGPGAQQHLPGRPAAEELRRDPPRPRDLLRLRRTLPGHRMPLPRLPKPRDDDEEMQFTAPGTTSATTTCSRTVPEFLGLRAAEQGVERDAWSSFVRDASRASLARLPLSHACRPPSLRDAALLRRAAQHHPVIEIAPGGGWYTEILAPYLRAAGRLLAAHYAADDRAGRPRAGASRARPSRPSWRPSRRFTTVSCSAHCPAGPPSPVAVPGERRPGADLPQRAQLARTATSTTRCGLPRGAQAGRHARRGRPPRRRRARRWSASRAAAISPRR